MRTPVAEPQPEWSGILVARGDKEPQPTQARRLRLVSASSIKVRPVQWLWEGRLALGVLALLGGREGIGKSLVSASFASSVTRGAFPGVYAGRPRGVIIAATEDSWEHTLVPRLMAAGADLGRVFRVDVETSEGLGAELSLPRDLDALGVLIAETEAALVILDPLMSRLDSSLDTHKDAEVRRALEPVAALANRTGAGVLGLIHVNKGQSLDPLTSLMGSRAFAAVARAVLYMMTNPDDEDEVLLGQPKNNLGRSDLPTLTLKIESAHVADTDEGPVWTGRAAWTGESAQSIRETLATAGEGPEIHTATAEAADWLADFLKAEGGSCDSVAVKAAAAKAGHAERTLARARTRVRVAVETSGFPRSSVWRLPGRSVTPLPRGDVTTGMTGATGVAGHAIW
jgi:hypothetical protein